MAKGEGQRQGGVELRRILIPFKEFELDPIVEGAIPSTYLNNVRE